MMTQCMDEPETGEGQARGQGGHVMLSLQFMANKIMFKIERVQLRMFMTYLEDKYFR